MTKAAPLHERRAIGDYFCAGLSCQDCVMDTMLEIAKRVDDFMMERSPVRDTMRRLARIFGDPGIPFAIAGAMLVRDRGHRGVHGV